MASTLQIGFVLPYRFVDVIQSHSSLSTVHVHFELGFFFYSFDWMLSCFPWCNVAHLYPLPPSSAIHSHICSQCICLSQENITNNS